MPCIAVYTAYELGLGKRTYNSSISFYEDVLEESLNKARKIKEIENATNFIEQELAKIKNDKEYKEQIIHP
jgi:cell division protein FtsB